jgi:hypothetical protein
MSSTLTGAGAIPESNVHQESPERRTRNDEILLAPTQPLSNVSDPISSSHWEFY